MEKWNSDISSAWHYAVLWKQCGLSVGTT